MYSEEHLQHTQRRIDTVRRTPLEPMEYCQRWVQQDASRGYRKMCIKAIAEATGLSPETVKDWGPNFKRRPRYVPHLLRQADLINQFKQLVASRQVILPPDFPTTN